MRAIDVKNPGQGYALAVADIAKPVAGQGEVLIKVAAAGLNRADIAQAMGGYPPPPEMTKLGVFLPKPARLATLLAAIARELHRDPI